MNQADVEREARECRILKQTHDRPDRVVAAEVVVEPKDPDVLALK